MKAIQYIKSIPRYALTKAAGVVYRPAFWGPQSTLQYREVPEPPLPGPQWVRVRTRYGGICGSDVSTVFLKDSPSLSAFLSFPFTLGHENVGVVAEVGPEVEGISPGDRVVADPLLPCAVRGIEEPCEFCRRGEFSLCQNFTEGQLAAGFSIGTCSQVGGSWSPCFVAHQSQLFPVPRGVSDENALMVEPFCVALHSVVHNLPRDDDTVVVLGSGTIGLCIVAALRALNVGSRVIVVAKYAFQGDMALRQGADQVIYLGEGDYIRALSEALGGKLLSPVMGKPVLVGGADLVCDCVGSARSIGDSLRLARSGGAIVLVGLASVPRGVDWTSVWRKELTIRGRSWYGVEPIQDRRVRGFQQALLWMAEGKLDLAPMVTHRFRLDDYKRALTVTIDKGRHRLIKSVFAFD